VRFGAKRRPAGSWKLIDVDDAIWPFHDVGDAIHGLSHLFLRAHDTTTL
jgi:hypothetical protein